MSALLASAARLYASVVKRERRSLQAITLTRCRDSYLNCVRFNFYRFTMHYFVLKTLEPAFWVRFSLRHYHLLNPNQVSAQLCGLSMSTRVLLLKRNPIISGRNEEVTGCRAGVRFYLHPEHDVISHGYPSQTLQLRRSFIHLHYYVNALYFTPSPQFCRLFVL